MFTVSVGEYSVQCEASGLPGILADYRRHAALSEDFVLVDDEHSSVCFVGAGRSADWPSLVVTQRYAPCSSGFSPGVLLVPETMRLFIGAGERLLAYDLSRPARLWEDEAEFGFWSWSRHGAVVLMAAELQLAAWDLGAGKLWSRFVEPPWSFAVADDVVSVDVMGSVSRVSLNTGEPV